MTAIERVELAQWEYERARQELHDAQAQAYAEGEMASAVDDGGEDTADLG